MYPTLPALTVLRFNSFFFDTIISYVNYVFTPKDGFNSFFFDTRELADTFISEYKASFNSFFFDTEGLGELVGG